MTVQCDAGTVAGTTIPLCSSGSVGLNNLTFTAKVRFTLPFPGTVSIWDNGTGGSGITTNINGASTIPADTWTTVTAHISDGGVMSTQLGINFQLPYDYTGNWSADIWLDDITIK
jgi:hypothetical protein